MFALSRWSGGLVARFGSRPPLTVGPAIAALGLALQARPGIGGSYWTTFFPAVVVMGFGMAITVAPLTTTVMTSIDDERHAGAASGINNTVARAAGLLAIALFGAIAVTVFARSLDAQLVGFPPPIRAEMMKQSGKLAAAQPPESADPETRRRIALAVGHAFVRAFRVSVIAAGVIAAASAGGALVIQRRK
jgi:MFS family permease